MPSRPVSLLRHGLLLAVAFTLSVGGTPAPGAESVTAATVSSVVDFDLQGFIDGELSSGKKRVVISPGRYRVVPQRGRHLVFKDLADVEIAADGVEMVCTQTSQAIAIERCRNFRLHGLTIDYDPLPFTQGRITALGPDKSWLEFELFEGYPDGGLEERIEIFDPATGELRRASTGWATFEPAGERRYRIAKRAGYRFSEKSDTEQVGDILVTNRTFAPGGRGTHAVVSADCTGLSLEDVTVYASNCFGFLEHGCDDSTYLRCKIDRRSPESDPVKRGYRRMRSLDADAFHSIDAQKGPAIIGCTAHFQGDDCVNIHGTYYMILASSGTQLRVAGKGEKLNIAVGDPVEFLPFEGSRPPDSVVTAIEPDAPMTEEEKTFALKLRMDARLREGLSGGKTRCFKISLETATPLPIGSLICSGNRVGNGFVVKDCDFGYNRSRGILIKASRGEVTGNRIFHSWMAAVLVAPEFWWLEAASASDVAVRGNLIECCRETAVEVPAVGGNGKPLASGAHRNIEITGNKIAASPWPNIFVSSTAGLVIQENQLTEASDLPPDLSTRKRGMDRASAIVTENCEAVRVQ